MQGVAPEPTGVLEAGGDCAPVHVHSHAGRGVAVHVRAVTELPLGIPSPAIQRTPPAGAGVVAARRERSPIFSGAHALRGQTETTATPLPTAHTRFFPSLDCSASPSQCGCRPQRLYQSSGAATRAVRRGLSLHYRPAVSFWPNRRATLPQHTAM